MNIIKRFPSHFVALLSLLSTAATLAQGAAPSINERDAVVAAAHNHHMTNVYRVRFAESDQVPASPSEVRGRVAYALERPTRVNAALCKYRAMRFTDEGDGWQIREGADVAILYAAFVEDARPCPDEGYIHVGLIDDGALSVLMRGLIRYRLADSEIARIACGGQAECMLPLEWATYITVASDKIRTNCQVYYSAPTWDYVLRIDFNQSPTSGALELCGYRQTMH